MASTAIEVARELLQRQPHELHNVTEAQFIRVYQFVDFLTPHDDVLQDRIAGEFAAAFEVAKRELAGAFGNPAQVGERPAKAIPIPLNGVFRFAVWEIEDRRLFLAAAHEDRELPFLLMIGAW